MSDATHLTNFAGDKKAWPVYMTIGNLSPRFAIKSFTLLELQSVIGFLSFAAKVVPLGRPFLRRLYNALSSYKLRDTFGLQSRRITSSMRADLRWWLAFLPQWGGITLIRPSRQTYWVWTDAAGTKGLGGYFLDHPDCHGYTQTC
jgi:hypothetical protein